MICDDNFYAGKCTARKEDGTCISKFPCSHKVELPKPPTNADRIRAMTDEDLAVLIAKEIVHVPLSGFYVAKSAWLRWLQETVDEVEHES